jgi:hypothetical protein
MSGVQEVSFARQSRKVETRLSRFDLQKWLRLKKIYTPTIRSSPMKMACRRKYLFRYRFGLSPRRYEAALLVGRTYHEVMAGLLRNAPSIDEDVFDNVVSDLMLQVEAWDRHLYAMELPNGILPWGEQRERIVADARKDVALGIAMARWIWDRDQEWIRRYRTIAVEKMITVKLKGLRRPIRLRIDSLLEEIETGEVWIQDHKTTSWDTLDKAKSLRWDVQPLLYRVGVDAWLQSVRKPVDTRPRNVKIGPLVGFVHCIIKKPTIRLRQNETFPDYLKRIRERYDDDLAVYRRAKGIGSGPPYLRSHIRFDPGPAVTPDLWIQLREADAMAGARVDLARYNQTPDPDNNCVKFGRPCPYLRLCQESPKLWYQYLDHYDIVSRDEEEESRVGLFDLPQTPETQT